MGVENWFLTLEENRLKVFVGSVVTRIYGYKRGELKEFWRKSHNE
jgi:hypothetical protein